MDRDSSLPFTIVGKDKRGSVTSALRVINRHINGNFFPFFCIGKLDEIVQTNCPLKVSAWVDVVIFTGNARLNHPLPTSRLRRVSLLDALVGGWRDVACVLF